MSSVILSSSPRCASSCSYSFLAARATDSRDADRGAVCAELRQPWAESAATDCPTLPSTGTSPQRGLAATCAQSTDGCVLPRDAITKVPTVDDHSTVSE